MELANLAAVAAASSQSLFVLVALVVGVRLLQLSYRTRQLPPLLLGVNFLFGSSIGYSLNLASILLAVGERGEVARSLSAAGGLFSTLGVTAVVVFVYQVFRLGETWAKVAAWLTGVWLWLVFLMRAFENPDPLARDVWWWLYMTAFAGIATWAAAEAFHYYSLMRRRRRLGLADPVLTNRFLLWGSGGLSALIMGGLGVTLGVIDAEPGGLAGSVLVSLIAVFGIVCVLCYWLTFFPTRAYVRFLRRHGEAYDSPKGEAGTVGEKGRPQASEDSP